MQFELLEADHAVQYVADTVQTRYEDLGSVAVIQGHHPDVGNILLIHNVAGQSAMLRLP